MKSRVIFSKIDNLIIIFGYKDDSLHVVLQMFMKNSMHRLKFT